MKPERLTYASEMTATSAAVGVFLTVYIVGFMQTGLVLTLLFAWLPAAALAWITARALHSAARMFLDGSPASGLSSFGGMDDLEPIALRRSRHARGPATHRDSDDRY